MKFDAAPVPAWSRFRRTVPQPSPRPRLACWRCANPPARPRRCWPFLPGPYEDSVREEVQTALIAAGRIDGSLDPVFLASLTAAVAGAANGRRLDAVQDRGRRASTRRAETIARPEASVRLAVAQELAIAGDKEAVPVLIELLAQVPLEQGGAGRGTSLSFGRRESAASSAGQ